MSDNTALVTGSLIWVKDEAEVWRGAEVVGAADHHGNFIVRISNVCSIDQDLMLAKCEVRAVDGESLTIRGTDPVYLRNNDEFTGDGLTVLDDLTQLMHLHEPAVLHSLQMRFDIDKIYSFCGPIVIAVNPFKQIHNLYSDSTLESFISQRRHNPTPHVYSTANAAFRGICDDQKSQTVLISGESGAGKTETTKIVMRFLAKAGQGDDGPTEVESQRLAVLNKARSWRRVVKLFNSGCGACIDNALEVQRVFGTARTTFPRVSHMGWWERRRKRITGCVVCGKRCTTFQCHHYRDTFATGRAG